MNDDLTRAETAAMFAMYDRPWTRVDRLPAAAVVSLAARGLVEVSVWAPWARLTGAGDAMFEVCA